MAWGKKKFYESVASVCFTLGTVFLVIAFFTGLGFLIGVIILSFALPIDLHKYLWNSETGLFTKIFLKDNKLLG